jgi:hypothetical protein
MRIPKKLAALTGTITLALGLTITMTETAHANVGTNWCLGSTSPGECINAWNGGPWVRLYTGGPTANGDFSYEGGTNHYLAFGNYGSPWANQCIGDANNDPGDARASLNPCPGLFNGNPDGDGWGTHVQKYTSVCPNGWAAFKDIHWNGWIGPQNESQGATIYLNKPSPYCYSQRGTF